MNRSDKNNTKINHTVNISLQNHHYQTTETIYSGSRTIVYRSVRINDRLPVVIKVLKRQYPTFSELVQFRNQYTIAKNLDILGIIKPYNLEPYQNGYALVMEDFGGISLQQFTQINPLTLQQFLLIAIQIANILQQLHQNQVIHKDIKPANILIHPQTQAIKLIDFSIASLLPRETQEIQNPKVLEGTLAYISPEQTGRMNRGIDYRSDFYSLGVTFYELLTGELPFNSHDPMELVHSHIAKSSPLVHEMNSQIPSVISKIVRKLMAKNAEDRYQSALGLKIDLENCLTQLQETGEIQNFEIGQRDLCDRFIIPEKLYGRSAEVQTLLDAFDRVACPKDNLTANGTTEMMLVAGFSGIGKTAVVNEVHKPIVRQRGYFIKGKYDQFNRNVPFGAFAQAFRDLMGQLLGESDDALAIWKTKILEAVGENGQVIVDIVPELEVIIGKQPPVPELSGSAAQNRFHLLFSKFVNIFTTQEHPLVIFLDDLQWADSASLNLLKVLMNESKIGYLLVLGAYRDNEVFPAHPLILTFNEMQKEGATISPLTLTPLKLVDITHLVADTLLCSVEIASPLAQLVYQKTQGNPFFTTQFLYGLHEDGYITFNRQASYWQCDLSRVRQLALTDDVVEFMVGRLRKLPKHTQEAIELAACIGNQFDLMTLAVVCDRPPEAIAAALWTGLQEGFIIPESETYKFFQGEENLTQERQDVAVSYRFLHDRVQQAAYALIPEEQKAIVHYQIGQLLLKQIPPEAREDSIFLLVNQLNYGIELIREQSERDELAQLNLMACHKARNATAYQAGREYAKIGLSLLGENPWQNQYEITLVFYELLAELASICGDLPEMETFVSTVIAQAKSVLEQANIYRIKVLSDVANNQLTEAIIIAKQFLQKLNIIFPETPTQEEIQSSIAAIDKLIENSNLEDFVNLPEMTDRKEIAVLQILNSIIPASYISNRDLFYLIITYGVQRSLQLGNTPSSVYAYACYGLILGNLNPTLNAGFKFGQLALQVASKLNAKAAKAQAINPVGLTILHRQAPLKNTLSILQEGYTIALEVGDYSMAGYNAHSLCFNAFWCGQPLAPLEKETRSYCQALEQFNQVTPANWCRIYWQGMSNFLGGADDPVVLSGKAFQETDFLPQLISANDLFGLGVFYLYKLILSYLFEDIQSAKTCAINVQRYLMGSVGTVGEPAFYFYDSLTILASISPLSEAISEALQQVEQNQTNLQENWANPAPMNHQHKVDLVEAEKYRVLGKHYEAGDWYDRAIAGAKKNEYIHEEALANELAAKFYLNLGKEKVAAGYMQEAYYCYAKWGSKAKIADLEKHYPRLLQPILQTSHTTDLLKETIARESITSTQSSSSISEALDLGTLLKASQAISGEIELNKLLTTLLEIVILNAGADKCVLLLKQEMELKVVALGENGALPQQLPSIPVKSSSDVPISLVNKVKRTLKPLVVADARICPEFMGDSYLEKTQPKSVLCSPILNQGQLIGILYLENNLTVGAFTRDRVEVLNVICSQAAISLENARLYQESQQALTDLQQAQLQIVQSEKMSTLGNLVAGVAHEINNPVGFLAGNIPPALEYIQDLFGLFDRIQEKYPQLDPEIQKEIEKIELDYIREDLPHLVDSMWEGIKRIQQISTSLRTFSRADTDYPVACNIHEGIDSTLTILKHRLKANEYHPEIKAIKDYGDLPHIKCYAGQLNQVFMNILNNAIDALEESNTHRSFAEIQAHPNRITIKTSLLDNQVKITIADNGPGMSESVKEKIFDHLFTTKTVGKGTGLGLAIAKSIVVEKHGGSIQVSSILGEGTEFTILLPKKVE